MKLRLTTYIIMPLMLLVLTSCAGRYRLERFKIKEGAQWPYHRGDANASGALPDGAFNGKLDVIWEYKSNDKPAGPLTIYHNRLIYPGARNKIKFLDVTNGHFQGQIKSKGTPQTGVVVKDTLAVFATAPRKNLLKCINLLDGDMVWNRQLLNSSDGALFVDDMLIVGSGIGDLLALSPISGETKWRFISDKPLTIAATYGAGKVFQPGNNGELFALSPLTGSLIWEVKLENAVAVPVAVGEMVFVGDLDGFVYGLEPKDGSIAWKQQVGGPVWTSPAIADGRIFVGHSGGELVALDAATGAILWRFNATDVVRASPVVAGGYVVFGNASGMLFSLDAIDGTLVEQRQLDGPVITSPVTDGNTVFVATEKGLITCLGDAPDAIDGEEQAHVSNGN